ncbi:electron transport complex subunit RsxC [Salinimonas lutimaris]|uniref:electron transport complex subunit RsxC n=1 Tax=Salinimonas lutimaris TaxID=914153 RepID=UPI0015869A95|nr:electron transport complex subunit RsxC [Salinimonas lutimaris]
MIYPDFAQVAQKLESGGLYDFPGGVHPDDRKSLSNSTDIARLPIPKQLVVPVRQHIGTQGQLTVAVNDKVSKGQPLTSSAHPFAIPVHAPTSGTVVAIEKHVTAHPSGLSELAVIIESDGEDRWTTLTSLPHYRELPDTELVKALCDAGISGMGGAGFPTHIKTSSTKNIEFMVINGAECEPYITADDRLMREHAWQIRQGIDVLSHLVGPKKILVAIEDNKPEAIKALSIACKDHDDIAVVSVPTKYPAGGEKQLIQVLTGREVPKGGLPSDIGITMFNVGTCYAVADAIFHGKPLIERVVTVTGEAVDNPGNVWALLGTPVNHLLSHARYNAKKQHLPQVIMGGPMMGFTISDADIPVVKITNCLLIPATGELTQGDNETACIRCSACADACPASLLPQQLYWHAKAQEHDKAEEYNLFDCIECGACAYVCPSEIPLVHYYRQAKAGIRLQRDEKAKAEKAKERFEARKARLEKEKLEREEKHRKAKEARAAAANKPADNAQSKDKVAAALARAKAKKQDADNAPADQTKDKVSAAIARAKAKKQAQQAGEQSTASSGAASADQAEPDDKKQKVAAAIARAKAKKQQAQNPPPTGDDHQSAEAPPQDERKQRVADAIARAKAKKAARENEAPDAADTDTGVDNRAATEQSAEPESEPELTPEEAKKQRVAAAVAKAKAKKVARENEAPDATDTDTGADNSAATEQSAAPEPELTPEEAKKQRVAAAVAKAKAKKAARENEAPDAASNSAAAEQNAVPESEPELTPEEAKKQRVAAAVAKAKAKKAARENEAPDAADTDTGADNSAATEQSAAPEPELTPEEAKKQRVAAAVAKAKAKKAARDQQEQEK